MLDVAVLTQDPDFFGGGVATQTAAFSRAARELGREPQLVYLRRPSPVPNLEAVNQLVAGVRFIGDVRAARSVWVVAAAASHGWAAARSRRPYACWLASGLDDEWAARRAALPRSRRVALGANAPVLRRLERQVLRRARLVFGISPSSRRSLAAAAGLAEERVRVLPIPVDVERVRPEPEEQWRERLDSPVIAFVGRASDPRKNVGLLLRARVPGTRVRLIGAPPAESVGNGVEVVGEVDAIDEHLRSASVFVLPSLQEGFGIVVAEALAAGVPAVVTPSGGPEELVRESGGGVVLSGFDEDELSATISALLSDERRLLEMRRRGRAYVERQHSPARFRELLAAAFAELDGDA